VNVAFHGILTTPKGRRIITSKNRSMRTGGREYAPGKESGPRIPQIWESRCFNVTYQTDRRCMHSFEVTGIVLSAVRLPQYTPETTYLIHQYNTYPFPNQKSVP